MQHKKHFLALVDMHYSRMFVFTERKNITAMHRSGELIMIEGKKIMLH